MNLYEQVTAQIVEAIERGVGKVEMPWHSQNSFPHNPISSTHYQGINTLILWASQMDRHYPTSNWATYRQWQEKGAQVRKGERGTTIVFYQKLEPEEAKDDKPSFVLRSYRVFNQSQTEGYEPPRATDDSFMSLWEIDHFIKGTGAAIEHGSDRAAYVPSRDLILMPKRSDFIATSYGTPIENYYSILFHELTHWTGAKHRLNRNLSGRFGDKAYAMEELVAELGSAFLCAEHQLSSTPREDHAAYIASWLSVLKQDSKAVFVAAREARRASEELRHPR